jgi:hypothetical protein
MSEETASKFETKADIIQRLAENKYGKTFYEDIRLRYLVHEHGYVLEAMDQWAKEIAIGFFKWYGVKMIGFLQYFQRKKENPMIYSIPDAYDKYIEEFEGQSVEKLFEKYIEHLINQPSKKQSSETCSICSRIIEEEAHHCEISDCPHR